MKIKYIITMLISCAIIAMPVGSAIAKDHKHAKKHGHKSLPPGLQKKQARGQALPPGWQKKLAVGHTLDHDVYAYASPISHREAEHYHLQPGEEIIRVENKVIRFLKATRTIVEILND